MLKVADQKVLGQLHVAQTRQVVGGLPAGLVQVFATRLHFNQKLTGIKAVNAATPSTELFDALLKADQALVGKTKNIAESANEVLRFTELVLCVCKVFGEVVCAVQEFSVIECDSHPEMLFSIYEWFAFYLLKNPGNKTPRSARQWPSARNEKHKKI